MELFKSYRIGILCGGISSEREISLKSGDAVFTALKQKGLDVVVIDAREESLLRDIENGGVNLVFIALHGRFGEDGTVQNMLSGVNMPYTGSGPEASKLAIDKFLSKQKFSEAGLSVPRCKLLSFPPGTLSDEALKECMSELMFSENDMVRVPCVVKPRYEGSSIGVSVVMSDKQLEKAVHLSLASGKEVLIEEYISGREITVGIMDSKPLPVIEISSPGGNYDFKSKYISESTVYTVPAPIDKRSYSRAQEYAIKAHKVLGCRGFSRVDMRITDGGQIYILELNTVPGLTEKSLLPMAALADGIDFGELCVKMLRNALDL